MNIVLGVSGSIAAYRAADLARELMRAGHTVRACLTDGAGAFVTAALFEGLTGQPCLGSAFEEPETGRMAHIDWAKQADLVLVAPATANVLNKLAAGIADDMLTTIALATTAPLVLAPAMNPQMFAHPTTQASLRTLAERGAQIVDAVSGEVACGDNGQGKLASVSAIVDAVLVVLGRTRALEGKHVVITSGPTQEPIDDVRYLTNRSSGKMGVALTRAALAMGAKVTLVTGPTALAVPLAATIVRVRTAEEMLQATRAASAHADLLIGAAAVADYRPAQKVRGKMRRGGDDLHLHLVPNPDILATIVREFPKLAVVAFAAEPDPGLETAAQKAERKGVMAIAVNDISRADVGFETDENDLTMVFRDGTTVRSGKQTKLGCAFWLLETLVPQIGRPN